MIQNYTLTTQIDKLEQLSQNFNANSKKKRQAKATSISKILAYSRAYTPIETKQLKKTDFIKN